MSTYTYGLACTPYTSTQTPVMMTVQIEIKAKKQNILTCRQNLNTRKHNFLTLNRGLIHNTAFLSYIGIQTSALTAAGGMCYQNIFA